MRVLYDHQIFVDQKYGGISRYFYELLHYYHNDDDDIETHMSLALSNNKYIERKEFTSHHNFLPNLNFRGKGRIIKSVDKLFTIKNLCVKDYDIFHPTYYDPYFLKYINSKPFVLTVYDMIHEKFEDMFVSSNNAITQQNTTQYKKLLASKASHIIAISNNTKNDLIQLLNIDESKISVVHLGNSLIMPDTHTQLPACVPDQFILFVGSRALYKNFENFIRAVAIELRLRKSLSVVCVGSEQFNLQELALFTKLGISGQVLHFDIDDLTLGLFYKNALFFVYPSLYEGFGIPILEAFACNCPLICSDTSSFPEVAGDAALYFDPYSVNSIHSAIHNGIENKDLLSDLIKRGSERVKYFTLANTALKTKMIYQRCI